MGASVQSHVKPWEVVSGIAASVLALGLMAGWLWSAAVQSGSAAEMDHRLTIVEKFKEDTAGKLTEVLVRLTRIETLLERK